MMVAVKAVYPLGVRGRSRQDHQAWVSVSVSAPVLAHLDGTEMELCSLMGQLSPNTLTWHDLHSSEGVLPKTLGFTTQTPSPRTFQLLCRLFHVKANAKLRSTAPNGTRVMSYSRWTLRLNPQSNFLPTNFRVPRLTVNGAHRSTQILSRSRIVQG